MAFLQRLRDLFNFHKPVADLAHLSRVEGGQRKHDIGGHADGERVHLEKSADSQWDVVMEFFVIPETKDGHTYKMGTYPDIATAAQALRRESDSLKAKRIPGKYSEDKSDHGLAAVER